MSTWNRNPWLWALSLAGMDVQLDVQDVQLDIRFHPWSKITTAALPFAQGLRLGNHSCGSLVRLTAKMLAFRGSRARSDKQTNPRRLMQVPLRL
ncbi:hypothetical protein AURDEDRAFT_178656 [Auricularia subglabra TFB-10046 SS5]|uniref:Uncharacterized protein n=1 Tax=Auricularia subglabra (strain TFB-10046 / SS5) TaxID=717982 RepID=J0WJ27_AURST|nr:hypothetical protein AURDEDRAFT_178656 [Auricularia subglabra TFB-10046 SS5]